MSDQTQYKRKAKNLQYIRKSNRAEIFRRLAAEGNATRLELAGQLGLSKMAISNIIKELIEEGLVCESTQDINERNLSPGRKSDRLTLCIENFFALGIYLSRDAVHGVLADIFGNIHSVWHQTIVITSGQAKFANNAGLLDLLGRFSEQIKTDLDVGWQNINLLGLGICSIGPLDIQTGTLLDPPNFYGIEMLNLRKLFAAHFNLPILIDNDMTAAVWAEHMYGAARNSQHALYLGLTNGIGAGILSYGRIFQGSAGFGGEVGHMSINVSGPDCSCGQKGCLETYLSLPVVFAKTGVASLTDLISASDNYKFRQSWLPDYLSALISGLVNLVNVFDPETILIGHEGAALVEDSIIELESSVNNRSFQRRAKKVRIKIAELGADAPLTGSACLVFQAIFRGDLEPKPRNGNQRD